MLAAVLEHLRQATFMYQHAFCFRIVGILRAAKPAYQDLFYLCCMYRRCRQGHKPHLNSLRLSSAASSFTASSPEFFGEAGVACR